MPYYYAPESRFRLLFSQFYLELELATGMERRRAITSRLDRKMRETPRAKPIQADFHRNIQS
jgi:hypothetical protein